MKELSPAAEQFILHWGEMSGRWGISRSVAQIHALLFISEEPLCAEDIASNLSLARSNVSTSLRELLAWGVARVKHMRGDRRDYYEAIDDAWEMFRIIVAQRKQREIDPTMEMLRECVDEEEQGTKASHATLKMRELLELIETLMTLYEQVMKLPSKTQQRLIRMGNKLQVLVGGVK